MEKRQEEFADRDEIMQLTNSAKDKVLKTIANTKDEVAKNVLRSVVSEMELIKRGILSLTENEKALREWLAKDKSAGTESGLREYVDTALRWAIRDGVVVSIIVFQVRGPEGRDLAMSNLQQLVRASLRRRADFVINNEGSIFVVLHETEKEDAVAVAERIRSVLDDYLSTKDGGKSIDINYKVASSSEGIDSFDAMIAKMGL
jgi:GGDEF domain-containing protein